MKAVIQTGYGSADVMELKEVGNPSSSVDQVLEHLDRSSEDHPLSL